MDRINDFLDYSYMMQRKNKEKERIIQSQKLQEIRIAVLCGSTFGVIEEFLEFFLLNYGIRPIFYLGEYNRYFEESCFENDELKKFSPEFILLHITNKNLCERFRVNNDAEGSLHEEEERLQQIWKSLRQRYHCIIIQNNFEYFPYRIIGNAARTHKDGSIRYIDNLNAFVSSYIQENTQIYINDIHFLSSYIGLRNWHDDRMWNLYKYPMSMATMPRYALNIANIIKSVLGINKKTIITDLDNTLWGGIIGEEGVEKIKLGNETPQGEAFALLQQYLKYLSEHGIILNICSKNEYETGMSGLRTSKSILNEEDFTIKKINWHDKHENIEEILKELNLADSSVVFMDDSQIECDSIMALNPEIEVIQMSNVGKFLDQIDTLSFFEMTTETNEDKKRNQYYKDNIIRERERKQFKDYGEYLRSLGMVCYVDQIRKENLERTVQLLNKTNQFNFLTNRYTEEQMTEMIQKKDIETFVLDLRDKFGDNGIISVSVVRINGAEAYINDWVMSCRVFERGIEFVMLKLIIELCMKKNVDILHGYYKPTFKNKKICHFFQELGFEKKEEEFDIAISEWICNDLKLLLEKCKTDSIAIWYN